MKLKFQFYPIYVNEAMAIYEDQTMHALLLILWLRLVGAAVVFAASGLALFVYYSKNSDPAALDDKPKEHFVGNDDADKE